MELTRAQETQLRRTGREAMEKVMAAAQQATQNGIQRATAKVTAVNSDCTADVDFGTDDYPMPLTGLRYTTGCCSMQVGDRVLVDTVSNQPLITGILANSDNGPYVKPTVSTPFAGGTLYRIDGIAVLQITNLTLSAGVARTAGKLAAKPAIKAVGAISYNDAAGYVAVATDGTTTCWSTASGDFSGQVFLALQG